jgi:pimeloyl-ACP methyl ester carboxylesterase
VPRSHLRLRALVLLLLAATAPSHAALDCNALAGADASTLQGLPSPRIVSLHGSVPIITMEPFAEFLIGMGYPEAALRDPYDQSLTRSSFTDSEALAGSLAWYYEHDAMRPMLIGHSQGGMMVMRVLHELAGGFREAIAVVDPATRTALPRTTIRDPYTGQERPVVGARLAFASAIATGTLPRLLLGQWTMIPKLRKVPDSAMEFTGFAIAFDPIAGNLGDPEPYVATGSCAVRNVLLPASYSHIGAPAMEHLPRHPSTRAWIVAWQPGTAIPLPADADVRNIELAADLWYSVRRHWCLEGQRAQALRNPS